MAVKTYSEDRKHGYIIVTWETLGNADTGTPYAPPAGYYLESVQFTGTLGGASLTINGSNDGGTTFHALDTETALGFAVPSGQAHTYRPATSGGTGSDVDAFAYFRARF